MNRLKETREEKGLSVYDLARKVGCSAQTIYNIEAGKNEPSLKLALEIAKAIGTELERLV